MESQKDRSRRKGGGDYTYAVEQLNFACLKEDLLPESWWDRNRYGIYWSDPAMTSCESKRTAVSLEKLFHGQFNPSSE